MPDDHVSPCSHVSDLPGAPLIDLAVSPLSPINDDVVNDDVVNVQHQ